MGKISLLDCTLRDGGYVNDWNFGERAIREIGRKITQTGVELFEIGFVKDVVYDKDKALFSDLSQIADMIKPKREKTGYVAMLDMGAPLPLERIPDYDGSSVDVFRVIFKRNKTDLAYTYIEALLEKGYRVFTQPVGTDSYSDVEFVNLIERFNVLRPDAFYIVDTFGMIQRKQFLRLLYLADNNLLPEIALGYHSHNNLQQAAGNAQAMVEGNMQRDLILDACIFGMGRGAGNLNMELFAEYLNENFDAHYRLEPMLEVIDRYLNDIYSKSFWGYSLPFYLSAKTGCHPNYGITYAKKGTLTVQSFHELLRSIDEKDKADFNSQKAEEYYRRYQEQFVDDDDACRELSRKWQNRPLLVLAPGQTLNTYKEEIKAYIEKEKPIIICTNFQSRELGCDYIFSSNIRRYEGLKDCEGCKKIITSNVRQTDVYDYMINFSSICCEEADILDNSGLMLLRLFVRLGIAGVTLAGFDGYGIQNRKNYVNSGLEYSWTEEEMRRRNETIQKEIEEIGHSLAMEFLTPSCYRKNKV